MKLIQYSSSSCGPCRIAKRYITETYPDLDYTIINVKTMKEDDEFFYKNFISRLSAIPRFIVLDDDNKLLKDIGMGFSINSATAKTLKNAIEKYSE